MNHRVSAARSCSLREHFESAIRRAIPREVRCPRGGISTDGWARTLGLAFGGPHQEAGGAAFIVRAADEAPPFTEQAALLRLSKLPSIGAREMVAACRRSAIKPGASRCDDQVPSNFWLASFQAWRISSERLWATSQLSDEVRLLPPARGADGACGERIRQVPRRRPPSPGRHVP